MDAILTNSTLLLGRAPIVRSMSNCAILAPIACSLNGTKNKPLLFRSPAAPNKLRLVASPNSSNLPVTSVVASAGGGGITQIDETQFSETVLKSDLPVLVEFVANWCGPCRLISPAMEALAQEYSDKLLVVKIDHDKNPKLIEEFKVYGLPTLILFKNGQIVPESRREGAITKVKLKEYVDTLLNSISVA